MGDLSKPDGWHEVVSDCNRVVHLAQPDTYGARITLERAQNYRKKRLEMDQALVNAINRDRIQQVVFACGTSFYGHQGTELRTEETPPNPRGRGPYIAPAIEALKGIVKQSYPIVEAYPGWVYGPGSWFAEYQLLPLSRRQPVVGLAGRPQIVSHVHVEDCARALLHLLVHGEPGKRYFIVDDMAVSSVQMVHIAAQALGVPGRTFLLPKLFCTIALGQIVTDSMTCDFRLSNQRLKALGFSFRYPDVTVGIPDVVQRWRSL